MRGVPSGNEDVWGPVRYSTVGIEFIAVFGLGVAGGMYVDRHSGGGIIYTLLGAASGFAAGLYLVFRVAAQYRQSVKGPATQHDAPEEPERKDSP